MTKTSLFWGILLLFSSAQAADSPWDFLTMDVCVDGKNNVIMGLSPLDPECTRRRDLLPSDKRIPYVMRRVQGLGRKVCEKNGVVKYTKYSGYRTGSSKTNVPLKRIDKGGIAHTKIISIVDQGGQEDCGFVYDKFTCPVEEVNCSKVCSSPSVAVTQQGAFSYKPGPTAGTFTYFDQDTFKNIDIVYWVDQGRKIKTPMDGYDIMAVSKSYAYIAGTIDGNGGRFWYGPECKKNPRSFNRFNDSWVLFPVKVPLKGTSGRRVVGNLGGAGSPLIGTSSPKKYKVDTVKGTATFLKVSCPGTDKVKALTTWERKNVTYTTGIKLDTIISSHFSNVAAEARQVERFYMTKEFGKTRWEAWKREDYVYATANDDVDDKVVSTGAKECDDPAPIRQVSAEALAMLKSQQCNAASPGAKVTNEGITMTIEGRKWYLTACADYTVIKKLEGGTPALLSGIPGLSHFFNGAAK